MNIGFIVITSHKTQSSWSASKPTDITCGSISLFPKNLMMFISFPWYSHDDLIIYHPLLQVSLSYYNPTLQTYSMGNIFIPVYIPILYSHIITSKLMISHITILIFLSLGFLYPFYIPIYTGWWYGMIIWDYYS